MLKMFVASIDTHVCVSRLLYYYVTLTQALNTFAEGKNQRESGKHVQTKQAVKKRRHKKENELGVSSTNHNIQCIVMMSFNL